MKAYVFPGQGAQFPGMGKDLYDNHVIAKELFRRPTKFWVLRSPKLCLKVRMKSYDKLR